MNDPFVEASPEDGTAESLSIGDLARETGLAVETIRMWERRYGRPRAERLPSGHRRYGAASARWLRRVAEAVAHGHRPGEVVHASEERLDAILAGERRAEPALDPAWSEDLVAFDGPSLRARLRAAASARAPLAFAETVVTPMLVAVGRAWADGRLDIRHEHFATQVVECVLREVRDRAAPADGAPRIVFATLPGERHALGIEIASLVASHAGARCTSIGADAPLGEIAAAARDCGARAVGISVSLANGGVDADRLIGELRDLLGPGVRLVVGGAGTRRPRRAPRDIEYVEDLARFDAIVREMTGAPAA